MQEPAAVEAEPTAMEIALREAMERAKTKKKAAEEEAKKKAAEEEEAKKLVIQANEVMTQKISEAKVQSREIIKKAEEEAARSRLRAHGGPGLRRHPHAARPAVARA